MLLKTFYFNQPTPTLPQNNKTPKQPTRNEEICLRHANSESVADLANEYGISVQRIHQIINSHKN